MTYAISTIWHERNRFLPAILAVAFSAVLMALEAGLLLGLLSMMSTPVDQAEADIWVSARGVRSVDLGRAIPEYWLPRVKEQPEVERVEMCIAGFGMWTLPTGTPQRPETVSETCMVLGTRLEPDSIALLEPLRQRPALVAALWEPMTIIIDESDCGRLGVTRVGQMSRINGQSVRVIGLIHGLKSLGGAFTFCSLETARRVLHYAPGSTTYLLARCRSSHDARAVAERLRNHPYMWAYTRDAFSARSRLTWMTTTKAGLALAFTAVLGLVVGAVVTSQTLYAATVAAQREYATLRAMGIPRWRLQWSVLAQSFWVGLGGIAVAVPIVWGLALLVNSIGTQVRLPWFVWGPAYGITMVMALGSGLIALRSLQQVDPVQNIR
jgi:putative ABC transport system permease protein